MWKKITKRFDELKSINLIFDQSKLCFFGNLLSLDDKDRLVYKLFETTKFVQLEVEDLIDQYELNKEWNDLKESEISVNNWKENVKLSINTFEINRLKESLKRTSKCPELAESNVRMATSCKKKKNKTYLNLTSKLANFCFKLRAGSLPLEVESQRSLGTKREERTCKICNTGKIEDKFHFCFECPSLKKERSELMKILPEGFKSFENIKLLDVITGGGNDKTIDPAHTVSVLFNMWKKRCTLKNVSSDSDSTPTAISSPSFPSSSSSSSSSTILKESHAENVRPIGLSLQTD